MRKEGKGSHNRVELEPASMYAIQKQDISVILRYNSVYSYCTLGYRPSHTAWEALVPRRAADFSHKYFFPLPRIQFRHTHNIPSSHALSTINVIKASFCK